MINMLERLFNEADLDSSQLMMELKNAKSLGDLQEALRNLMKDPILAGAFRYGVEYMLYGSSPPYNIFYMGPYLLLILYVSIWVHATL